MLLTRRMFLQLVGASVAATTLRPLTGLAAAVDADTYWGRAFTVVPVYATPNAGKSAVRQLWPDSMVSIVDQTDNWYRLENGWVRRVDIQPMLPYKADEYVFQAQTPFWAEVAAPVASVRAYCSADAPLITRVGHGGVMQVIDALPGEPNGWYGVADENGVLLGWSQGVFWRPVTVDNGSSEGRMLRFDRQTFLMSAFDHNDLILQVPFSSREALEAGQYQVRRGAIGGGSLSGYAGVPWTMKFGQHQAIAGAYWHNQFGHTVSQGSAIQLTPVLARWVYGWLGDNGHIMIE
ncbi:MAG: hypothetical protein IT321_29660 [Anaerolineae bacterium]|nr:hypothetical protein [Anaerolineae bacterium]